jgi:hypothetical protein
MNVINYNSVALVHKRTTWTERPRLVGEVSANLEKLVPTFEDIV